MVKHVNVKSIGRPAVGIDVEDECAFSNLRRLFGKRMQATTPVLSLISTNCKASTRRVVPLSQVSRDRQVGGCNVRWRLHRRRGGGL
eukprot:2490719-Pyramimonas_sp.AAC.1